MESSIVLSEASCPLCGSSKATVVSETSYTEIWSHLRTEWGAEFSDAVRSAHTAAPFVRLMACSECRLQYFSPAVPGNSQFYSELTSSCSRYYTEGKWEFDHVRSFLRQEHDVLDVACGKGVFLRSIIGSVATAIGIDTNPDVMSYGNEADVRILNQTIEEFSTDHGNKFDVVSAFQVIEHLESVMPFVSSAYRCVKPGGILILSVPNRERRRYSDFGSLDYPPHHLSRWREEQLAIVAGNLNAELVSIAKEPLDESQTIGALRIKELPELIPYEFVGRNFVFKVISRLALSFPFSPVWRKLKISERLGMYGMSMVAMIRKPAEK